MSSFLTTGNKDGRANPGRRSPLVSTQQTGGASANEPADAAAPRVKRTFKEKFFAELNADERAASAGKKEKSPSKQALCIDILINGYAQSYVDFFYLTHPRRKSKSRPSRAPSADSAASASNTDKDEVDPESLEFLKNNLVLAESAARKGDMESMYSAYGNLAKYFEDVKNHHKAIFFYGKCLDVASKAGDTLRELEANLNLGRSYEKEHELERAISFHEQHLTLAQKLENHEQLVLATANLIQVYNHLAEEATAAGDLKQSVHYLEKCMMRAAGSGDKGAEGACKYKLGLAWEKLGEPQSAIRYHDEYLQICRASGDKVGEGKACSALAQAYQDIGDVEKAIANLDAFLELAKTRDPPSQARACCSLGVIYNRQHKFDLAVTYFEKFFEVARSLGDHQMLDVARVNLGIARGCLQMGIFVEVVNTDLYTLLQWKTVRKPLGKPPQEK